MHGSGHPDYNVLLVCCPPSGQRGARLCAWWRAAKKAEKLDRVTYNASNNNIAQDARIASRQHDGVTM